MTICVHGGLDMREERFCRVKEWVLRANITQKNLGYFGGLYQSKNVFRKIVLG